MTDDLARALTRDPGADPIATPASEGSAPEDVALPVADAALAVGPGPVPGPAPALPEGDASLLALVDRLAALLERSDLLELQVEAGGTGIVLRKAAAFASAAPGTASGSPDAGRGDAGGPGPGGGGTGGLVDGSSGPVRAAVLAPLTGIFYASPSPGSPPFVDVGREVVVGQVIGLIEAMKLFNEIKSDKAGRVVRVVAENGALVKAKHPLIEVEPL